MTRPPRNHGKKKEKKSEHYEDYDYIAPTPLLTYCPDIADHSIIYCHTHQPLWITTEQGTSAPMQRRCRLHHIFRGNQSRQIRAKNVQVAPKKYYNPSIVSMTPFILISAKKVYFLVHSNGNAIMCEMSNRPTDDDRIGSGGAVTNTLAGQKLVFGEKYKKNSYHCPKIYMMPHLYTLQLLQGLSLELKMKVIDEDLEKAAIRSCAATR